MNHCLILFLTAFFSFSTLPVWAQITKSVVLKDGSILKGKVLELKNGIYTIETENLGTIQIKDNDISDISSSYKPSVNNQSNPFQLNNGRVNSMMGGMDLNALLNNPQIMGQILSLQQTLMSDPQMMTELQKLMEDENITRLFSDPDLLNSLLSGDSSQIQNSPEIHELMNNPQIMKLMEKIQPATVK